MCKCIIEMVKKGKAPKKTVWHEIKHKWDQIEL
jgi:hypothetical protein